MSNQPGVRWWWHLVVGGFLALVIGRGVYGLVTQDARFGWRMYINPTVYRITYTLVSDVNPSERMSFTPSFGLAGRAQYHLQGGKELVYWYGPPFVVRMVREYLTYLAAHGQIPPQHHLEAQLDYRFLGKQISKTLVSRPTASAETRPVPREAVHGGGRPLHPLDERNVGF